MILFQMSDKDHLEPLAHYLSNRHWK